jgi:hypothetical protein
MGYHKLGMQAIGIVYVSKHDGGEREKEISKTNKKSVLCAITLV